MKKLSIWKWDGIGLPPDKYGFQPVNFIAEGNALTVDDQIVRIADTVAGLGMLESVLVNCEKWGKLNLVNAIRCAIAARSANDFANVGIYLPQVNGDKWAICGKVASVKDHATAIQHVNDTIRALSPHVDFWPVDLFDSDNDDGTPIQFNGLTPDSTWEVIATRRVSMLEHTDKPWWGIIGVKSIPGKDATTSRALTADQLYARAQWCRDNGAEACVVMVWDDARKKHQGVGSVALTPEIDRALKNIAQL